MVHRPSRRSLLLRVAAVAVAACGLLAATATPAGASATHSSTVTVRRSVWAREAGTATVAITATASAGTPAIVERATVRLTAHSTASARGTASARVKAHGRTYAAAHARARSLATHRARALALARARALARSRAVAAARALAIKEAIAAARARALAAARAAAANAAAARAAQTPVAAPAQPCGSATPPGTTGTWTCTLDDEFNGTSLNTTYWSPMTTAQLGFRNPPGCFVDSPDNISVSGGTLNLTARPAAAPFTCHDALHGDYQAYDTSGSVTSKGKFAQAFGVFSIRAKFPAATVAGLQSSLWLWPAADTYGAWPASGELDIAEEYSLFPDRAIPTLHYYPTTAPKLTSTTLPEGTNTYTNYFCTIDNVNAFHTYTMTWQPGTITMSYDGRTCLIDHYSATDATGNPLPAGAPFDQPFFINLTQAFGVNDGVHDNSYTPSTPLPATTEVDYVRVWQHA